MPTRALRRDQVIILLALLGVTALGWLYLVLDRQRMIYMTTASMDMPPATA